MKLYLCTELSKKHNMLRRLYIKNYTLIDELDMEFRPGFSVITGETGAGKSIILGAIGLLLGQRADSKTLKQGACKCVIEAHFDLAAYHLENYFEQNDIEFDPTDTIVRRELTAQGKSRAFVNDTPVPLTLLKELGERLMDVHSQHQNLLLGQHDFQLQVVDTLAADNAELEVYTQSFADYRLVVSRLEDVRRQIEQDREHLDFLQFQFDELTAAHLVAGEQEELETRADTMTHAEDIKQGLYHAETILQAEQNGVVEQLRQAVSSLRSIEHVYPQSAELASRMDSCYIELKDVAGEVSSLLEDIDFDPTELDNVNQRLDRLYDLQKKYHVENAEALLDVLHDVEAKLNQIENGEDRVAELEARVGKLKALCHKQADTLTGKRQAAATIIEQQMQRRLMILGMPTVRFKVEMEKGDLQSHGQDKVAFLFSANTSSPLQNIAQVASGGEIARVMLALKAMISGAVKLPTIVFDEIDTGVSGKIAEQMAQMMSEMGAQKRQVISITHLPQIAAKGTTHYKVFKIETPQGTLSQMKLLSDDERVTEIAQMLSGENVSEAAIQNARELLGQ